MRAPLSPGIALLAFALAWPSGPGAQDVSAAAERLLTAIPGTRLHAAVPEGFSLAGDFPGLRHALTETTVVVSELERGGPAPETWLDAHELADRGVELEQVEPLELADGEEGELYRLLEDREPMDMRHWVLLDERADRRLVAVATTPLAIETRMRPEVVGVLQSLAWEGESAPDPQADQPFRVNAPEGFRVAAGASDRVSLWRTEQLGPARGTDPRAYVTRDVVPAVEIELGAFAIQHLAQSDQVAMLELESSAPAKLGGLEAVELLARATAFDGAGELIAYQRMALDGETAYAVQAFAPYDEAERFVPRFRALAESFRRAR